MASTHHWRTNETTLTRNSFNAIVTRKEKDFDAPADLCKTLTMGKNAILGPDYIPNAVLARVMSGTLSAGDSKALSRFERKGNAIPTSTLSMSMKASRTWSEGDGARWAALTKPTTRQSAQQSPAQQPAAVTAAQSAGTASSRASSATGDLAQDRDGSYGFRRSASESQLRRPDVRSTAMAYKGSGPCTYTWNATETDMTRHSFNKIVGSGGRKIKANFDAPESICRTTTMGRQAERGPNWIPNAIGARRLAGTLK
mmetsp:Transcript_3124/g.9099  ORF Transcript_3124/g.9099 Transcript_3124/m.9099 type:complete len:256 (-) Transcript_3124:123-890(-)